VRFDNKLHDLEVGCQCNRLLETSLSGCFGRWSSPWSDVA